MRFLFKLIVLGFIGLALLPALAPEQYRQAAAGAEEETETPSPLQLMFALRQAAADLGNICTRQPGMCETGAELVSYAGSKAREGLEIAYAIFRHGHPSMGDDAQETPAAGSASE